MKKILLFAPDYLHYDILMLEGLRAQGFSADLLENAVTIRDILLHEPVWYAKSVKFIRKFFRKILRIANPGFLTNLDPYLCIVSAKYAYAQLTAIVNDYDYILVVRGDAYPGWFYGILRYRQRHARFIAYQYDDMIRLNKPPLFWKKYFDRVYSYNFIDCNRYEFKYLPMFYVNDNDIPYDIRPIDVLFVGSSHSGRDLFVSTLLKKYPDLKIEYYLLGQTAIDHIVTQRKALPYEDYIELLSNSRIVIDLPYSGQSGATTRIYEALGTKTKIISTNQNMMYHPLYQYHNIDIISLKNPEIDMSFLRDGYKPIPQDVVSSYSLESWVKKIIDL